jgi:hypothetical protein
MKKVRRRLVDEQVRAFMDAAQFVVDHPLVLWAPGIDRAAKLLIRAVAKHQRRSQAWQKREKEN